MKRNWKSYLLGLVTGLSLIAGVAYAKKQNVSILPSQTVVVNRENQAMPVYGAQPIEIKTSDKSPLHIRTDKPLKVEWSKGADQKWEYRAFNDAEDLLESMKTRTVQEALNKLGNDGWEMVSPYVLKRMKN